MNTIAGGRTGSAAAGIVGVSGTGSLDIGSQMLETAVGENASDAVVGSESIATTRDIEYYGNNVSSDSIRYFQSIVEAVGIIINNDRDNSELFYDSELD